MVVKHNNGHCTIHKCFFFSWAHGIYLSGLSLCQVIDYRRVVIKGRDLHHRNFCSEGVWKSRYIWWVFELWVYPFTMVFNHQRCRYVIQTSTDWFFWSGVKVAFFVDVGWFSLTGNPVASTNQIGSPCGFWQLFRKVDRYHPTMWCPRVSWLTPLSIDISWINHV